MRSDRVITNWQRHPPRGTRTEEETFGQAFRRGREPRAEREFPVFTHNGLTFGVVICSDGGYIEPARLLAIKGAKVIFAPHFNYAPRGGD